MRDITILIDDFSRYMRSKNKSENTINNYKKDIIEFNSYMEDSNKNIKKLAQVVQMHIEGYTQFCNDKGNSAKTINRKLSSLSTFFDYLIIAKAADDNMVARVERPKVKKNAKSTSYLTFEEAQKLLQAIKDYKNYRVKKVETIRDYAIIQTFLSIGLRANELASLTLDDIKFSGKNIGVLGKGGDYVYIATPDAVLNSIQEYLKYRNELKPKQKDKNTLFISREGTKYTTHGLTKMVKKYAYEADIDKDISAHSLRHTLGFVAYRKTKDLEGVQKLLRHKSPITTTIYTNVDEEHIRNVVNAVGFGE